MNRNLLRQLGVECSADGPPTILHYRLVRQLGMGGMGVVFEAIDGQLDRTVAIKFLKPQFLIASNSETRTSHEATRQRFVAEARAMAAINHPTVAIIHSVEERGPVPFLVMERLVGESLAARIARCGKLDQRVVVDIATQVADALDAAHGHGIVHRDVKPSNIWLEQDTDRVKVLDFGLAEPVDPRGKGQFSGTPAYLSPEQAKSEPVDARADLYSLGIVMHQMLTGRLPFPGKTPAEMLVQIVAGRRSPLAETADDVASNLAAVVDRLLQKDPAHRFSSAKQLLAALSEVNRQLNATWPRRMLAVVTSGRFVQTAAMYVVPGLLAAVLLNQFQKPSVQSPTGEQSSVVPAVTPSDEIQFSVGTVQTLRPISLGKSGDFVELRFKSLPPTQRPVIDAALRLPRGLVDQPPLVQCKIECEGVPGFVAEASMDRFKYAGEPVAIPLTELVDFLNQSDATEFTLRLSLSEKPKLEWSECSLRVEVAHESSLETNGESKDG